MSSQRLRSFDLLYSRVGNSPTLTKVWRAAFGAEYPEETEPLSYATKSQLEQMARDLRITRGETFLDLGCGRGGPGLFVAARCGANVVGVDFSAVAVREATKRAASMAMGDRARYVVGSIDATGLDDASVNGVLAVDVLQVARRPSAALEEVARVLAPGGSFVFSSWEADPIDAGGEDRIVRDYRPSLERAGFRVERCERPTNGLDLQLAVYRGLLESEGVLRAELGIAAEILLSEARDDPAQLERGRVRRVLVSATKI